MPKKQKNNISHLLDILDSLSPFSLQESWDNSGLILGSKDGSFKQIYVALEVTQELLEQIKADSLLITHHPLIFSPLKQLISESYPSSLLCLAIQKNIQLIAMHTNFDKTHFGKYITKKILGIKNFSQEEFLVQFQWDSDFHSLCALIKEKFKLQTLKITQTTNPQCKNIALITGSGGSFISKLNHIDCFITGDIKYHEAMEGMQKNIHLIDCGHYELERYFGEILSSLLTNLGYKAIILDSKNPFSYI
ncbi:Nif3-like dinuclear metal center hexameric protein [Helicobacter sp. 14348-15]|uniref:Nif3-like dinuclear metal center hexameric protein n=1 Tax=Helicobacter colisuis TaxID=2949739 RepID=UPI00202B28DF|nr:Nif3-like dinuclear metal center hexameric protein [Helicobacter colisuis]MCL9820667.1 Nif3-like dinuclear metal center hexameric protein [Helicobacter colisuis]